MLVVDDDEGIRTVVQWQLNDAGFDVAQTADGLSAMSFMAVEVPLLVILDLSLPALGGLDVLREIRTGAAQVPADLPVIILSGRSGETDRIVGLDLGADDYLVKPFSPGELAARLGEATVTEHVHRLRTKLGARAAGPLIRTVRGVGYQFDPGGPSR